VSCVIISRRANIKYLLEYSLRHLYYFFTNKDQINSKLNLFNNIKLYEKFFDTKISKLDILDNKKDNKTINHFTLLR